MTRLRPLLLFALAVLLGCNSGSRDVDPAKAKLQGQGTTAPGTPSGGTTTPGGVRPTPGGTPGTPPPAGNFSWTQAAPLPADRVAFTPGWTVGDFFHVGVHDSRDMWMAQQNASGQLGSWTLLRGSYHTDTKWMNPCVSQGERVYAYGHWGQARRTTLDPATGDVASWQRAQPEVGMGASVGANIPLLWGAGTLATVGGRSFLYHVGGFAYEGPNFTNPRAQDRVYFAEVQASGELTNWRTTTRMPYTPMSPSAVVHQGYLYCLGGVAGRFGSGGAVTGNADRIYAAPINADGTLGAWSQAGTLPYAAGGIATFVLGDQLYVIGGETLSDGAGSAGQWTDACARVDLAAGSVVGAWQTLSTLPAPTGKTPHGFIGSTFYVLGRSSGGSTPVYAVQP